MPIPWFSSSLVRVYVFSVFTCVTRRMYVSVFSQLLSKFSGNEIDRALRSIHLKLSLFSKVVLAKLGRVSIVSQAPSTANCGWLIGCKWEIQTLHVACWCSVDEQYTYGRSIFCDTAPYCGTVQRDYSKRQWNKASQTARARWHPSQGKAVCIVHELWQHDTVLTSLAVENDITLLTSLEVIGILMKLLIWAEICLTMVIGASNSFPPFCGQTFLKQSRKNGLTYYDSFIPALAGQFSLGHSYLFN